MPESMLRLKWPILIPWVQFLPIVGLQRSTVVCRKRFASVQLLRSPAHGMLVIMHNTGAIDIQSIMHKLLIFFLLIGAGIDIKKDWTNT